MTGTMTKGSWSEAEDNMLRAEYMSCDQNWSVIATRMTGRTAKQCRERWVQNLRPELTHGTMTDEECAFILDSVNTVGQKWAEIARRLQAAGIGCRSDNAVKNWYNGTINRQKRSVARHNKQSMTARGRAPAPLNLSQPQRPLPPPPPQRTPTTPVHSDYVYGSHHQHNHQQQHQYYSPADAHHRHAVYDDRSPAAATHAPGPQLPPLHNAITRDHRSNESHWQHQHYLQQQPQPMAASSSYGPSSYYQHPAPRYADRRSSVYTTMGSPRSDAYEHLPAAPSLISDAGSPPSARESPMNVPVSPSTAIPPMSTLPGFASNEKEMAALHLQSLRSSSSSMDRSWSSRSDEHYIPLPQAQPQSQHMAHRRLPPPAPIEPAVHSVRPSSSGRAMDVNSLLNRF